MLQDQYVSARAVYDAAASRYVDLVGTEVSAATEGPVDRALLSAFVEMVRRSAGRVVDVGCGPGRVAAFLARHGVDVLGVDVSPAMLDAARTAHPDIEFREGRLDALPVPTGGARGAVCWYSIMHTPPDHLDDALGELRRILAPGGVLLLAFPSGASQAVRRPDAYGTALPLTTYRYRCVDIARRLEAARFDVHATAERAAELAHESSSQAFVIAHRP